MTEIRAQAFQAIKDGCAVSLAEESWEQFFPEVQPLMDTQWREIATYRDIPLAVNMSLYRAADTAGHLTIIVARSGGRIVGYSVFFVTPHYHYQGSLQAQADVIYVDPAVRGCGIGAILVAYAESVLLGKGCQVIHHHVKLAHPALGILLKECGYCAVETIYSKRLDRA